MDMITGLIGSLKLNETLFIQFVVFLIGYSFLYFLLFKPYNKAAQERLDRTKGSEESADEFDEEIELLKRKYSAKVKETNVAVKEVFKGYEQQTKRESAELLENANTKIRQEKESKEKEVEALYQQEKNKVPALAQGLKEDLKKVLVGIS